MSTQSKSGILAFVDRYDQQSVQSLLHAGAELSFLRACTVYMGGYPPSPILVAVGFVGAEKLVEYIDAYGLDGVRAVCLVGVTAPWAAHEATCRRCGESVERAETGRACRAHFGTSLRIPLSTLEPLRAVAEMARAGASCECTEHGGPDHSENGPCASGTIYPLRLIIACAPDDGVCAKCGGNGILEVSHDVDASGVEACPKCSVDGQPGSGKALSSNDVALELGLEPMAGVSCGGSGGLLYLHHPTKADLTEHGLRAVLELAVKE